MERREGGSGEGGGERWEGRQVGESLFYDFLGISANEQRLPTLLWYSLVAHGR